MHNLFAFFVLSLSSFAYSFTWTRHWSTTVACMGRAETVRAGCDVSDIWQWYYDGPVAPQLVPPILTYTLNISLVTPNGSGSNTCVDRGCEVYADICVNENLSHVRYLDGRATCSYNVTFDCSRPTADDALFCGGCPDERVATLDSAFYTGTHSNPPSYQRFKLPSNCPKTVVPLSSLPNSSSPAIDNNNQLNVAVSLDESGNYVSDGWSGNYTQAIFVSSEQTREQLGCISSEPDGYFVFCSNPSPTDSAKHVICGGLPCPGPGGGGWPPSRPPDIITPFPFVPPGGGGSGGSNSNSNGGIANLTKWEDMLKRVIPTPPNPIPLLREIKDKLFDFYDGVMDWIKPQDDPELEDFDFDIDDWKLDSLDIDIDTNLVLDTIPDIDTKWLDSLFPKQDLEKEIDSLIKAEEKKLDSLKLDLDDILNSAKNKLDSLKPDTAKTVDKTKEKVLETFKDMADKIKEAVSKGLKPIENALPKGDGDCSCLESNFKGLSFGVTKGNVVTIGAMGDIKVICDNISVIRHIIMVIVAITGVGMILATLRR